VTIKTKAQTKAFDDNFDRIFGSDAERKKKREAEKAEKAENVRAFKQASASIGVSFEPFKSPIDGKMINSRAQLKEHNRRHEVTDVRDYGNEWFDKKRIEHKNNALGNTEEARQERRQLIEKNLYKYGVLR